MNENTCPNGLTESEIDEIFKDCKIEECENCKYLVKEDGIVMCTCFNK